MSTPPAVTYAVDADRVGWIVFDDPTARANVLHGGALAALDAAIAVAEADPTVRAIVVASGKERIFIAGADLKVLAALIEVGDAANLARRGQALFQRVASLRVPVVGAIHGACAGGGFELALACRWRIASDAAFTRIGLPETGIGVIPGWGGCVRLPRLVGVRSALEHILKGQLVDAAAALKAGFVDEVVPAAELRARAKAKALALASGPVVPRPVPAPPADKDFAVLRDAVMARTRGHQPALLAAIDAVQQGWALPVPEALEVEVRQFAGVAVGEVARNLLHVFFLREAARKRTLEGWFPLGDRAPRPIRRVGIVGAGVMGSGIAHWLAVHGCEVVLRDIEPQRLEQGRAAVRRLLDDAVKRGGLTAGRADAALQLVATTTEWDGFDRCDLVIEAIVEDVAAKRALFTELAGVVARDALLASNTSALPIEEIAGHLPDPTRVMGIHFFNPVSRMPLVELVLGSKTSADTAARALAWVKGLEKSPIICRSSPGFLVTRVLFFYLNEAVRLWEQGVATAAMDEAMREFGWPMGPMRLIDEVGVDVTDFIFGEMAHYFSGRFSRSTACGALLAAGLKGRKGGKGEGFYTFGATETPNDAVTRRLTGATRAERALPAAEIVTRLMKVLADEAERCVAEGVVRSPDDVDFALLSGAGFPAFRGGLLRWSRRTTP